MRPLPRLWMALATVIAAVLAGRVNSVSATAGCAPSIAKLASGQGKPDDVAFDESRILFGDQGSNSLLAVKNGRVTTLARHLHDPEGIVVRGKDRAVVAEQETNRLVAVDLHTGTVRTMIQLTNATKNLGIDGIGDAGHGGLLIPDSPNGRLLSLDSRRRLHVVAGGMGRPVDALRFRGGVAVADETASTVWLVRGGRLTRLGTFSTPDDVAVFHGALLAVTLGDHALWEVWPHVRLLSAAFAQPQGLAVGPHGEVVVADTTLNALYRISGLRACL
jgi:hypothetical protein